MLVTIVTNLEQRYYFFLTYANFLHYITFFLAYIKYFSYLCTRFRHRSVVSSTYILRTIYGGYTEDIRRIKLRTSVEQPSYPPRLTDHKTHTRMAHVETNVAIDSFQGKLKRNDRIVYRTRNGRTHAYAFDHPFRGTASEEQAQTRSTFGMAVKQASAILKDPEQKADWERRYASYRKHYRASSSARYYSTLRGFIIATLNAELKGE